MKVVKSNILRSIKINFFLLFVSLSGYCAVITSQILDLKAENNFILINVAKSYPKVNFSYYENPPKLLIELLDTDYHKTFSFTNNVKKSILEKIDFVKDVSVGVANSGEGNKKVGIILKFDEDIKFVPKTVSTKDNIIKISLLNQVNTDFAKDLPQKSNEISLNFSVEKVRTIYNQAVEKHLKGDLKEAEKLYKEAISNDKNFYLASFNLAKLLIDTQEYDEAILILSELLENLPSEIKDISEVVLIQNTLGNALYLKGNYQDALSKFNDVLKKDPNYCLAYYGIGLVYEKIKDLDQAKLNFEKIIDLCKTSEGLANAYYHLGVVSLISKNKKEAISGFKKVLELLPKSKIAELSQNELDKLGQRKQKLIK